MKERWRRILPGDRTLMLTKMPFIGSLTMQMGIIPVVDDSTPTAATNGTDIFVNPYYLEPVGGTPQTGLQRQRLLAHEVMHAAMSHFHRRGNRDPHLWNVAADCEINRLILADFVHGMGSKEQEKLSAELMAFGCWGEQVFGKGKPVESVEWKDIADESAERLYDRLVTAADQQQQKKGGGQSGPGGSGSGKGQGLGLPEPDDQHRWDPKAKGAGAGMPGSRTRGENGEPKVDPDLVMTPETEQTRHQWNQNLLMAAMRHERKYGRGKLPGSLSSVIEALTTTKVPWEDKLTRFVDATAGASSYDTTKLNRRHVLNGIYLPGRRAAHLNLNVAFDTSGSVSDEDLGRFLGCVQQVVETFPSYRLRIYQCDTALTTVEEYDKNAPFEADRYRITGRGGTAFAPVLAHIGADTELNGGGRTPLLYFTDLEGDNPPKPDYPVLWCKVGQGAPSVTWGEHIQID